MLAKYDADADANKRAEADLRARFEAFFAEDPERLTTLRDSLDECRDEADPATGALPYKDVLDSMYVFAFDGLEVAPDQLHVVSLRARERR